MRTEQPARRATGDVGNARRPAVEHRGESAGRGDHQPAGAAVESDGVPLVVHAAHERRRVVRDVLVDEKERRTHAVLPQRV